jgi:hypothetical protein
MHASKIEFFPKMIQEPQAPKFPIRDLDPRQLSSRFLLKILLLLLSIQSYAIENLPIIKVNHNYIYLLDIGIQWYGNKLTEIQSFRYEWMIDGNHEKYWGKNAWETFQLQIKLKDLCHFKNWDLDPSNCLLIY